MRSTMIKDVEANTKVAIAEAVDPLKSDLHDLQSRVQLLETVPGGAATAQHEGGAGMPDPGLTGRIDEIEKTLETMRNPGRNPPTLRSLR